MSGEPIEIDRDAERAPYLQLADALRAMITSGELPPGRRIPSLPELEERSGLSRNTVFKAIELLRDEGVIRASKGRGMFVPGDD